MGIVNVFKGLGSERTIYNFNGRIRKNLDLDWKHCKMLLGDREITRNYSVNEDDVVYIREYPGAVTTGLLIGVAVVGVVTAGVGVWAGVTARNAARDARRKLDEALDRIGGDNRRRDVESIPHLSGARNEFAEGKQAPIILGRHLFAPYFLSEPYMRPSGDDGIDLHWYGTFLVGQTGLNLEKIRNGMIDLISFNDTVYRNNPAWTGWRRMVSSGTPNTGTVTREDGALVITGASYTDRSLSLSAGDVIIMRARQTEGVLGNISAGHSGPPGGGWQTLGSFPLSRDWQTFRYVVRNDANRVIIQRNNRATVDGRVEISDFYIGHKDIITPSGTYAFDRPQNLDPESPPPFHDPENRVEVRQGGWFEEEIFNERWVDSLEANVEIGRARRDNAGTEGDIFIGDDGPDPVVRESARFPMRVEAEILIDGLHGWDSNHGVPTPATVDLSVEWGRGEDGPWTPLPGWGPNRITRAVARQLRFVAAVDLPASVYSADGAPVYIRATRLTRQHVGSHRSRTVLAALRTKQYSPGGSSAFGLVPARNIAPALADKFCRIGIKIKVNRNTQDALDRFNAIASMTGRTWGGNRWSDGKTATSNPAAVALEVMTGLVHGPSRHGDPELDLESLGGLYDWCDSREVTVAGSGLRPVRLESCGVLTGATRKIDALQRILATCDAGMYVSEFGLLKFWYDDFKTVPEALLNPQRIVSMNESRGLHRRADGYGVRFVDRDGDWSERTERVLRPRVEAVQGMNTFDPFNPEYVTDHYHAMWLARRSMAREILQPGEITIEVGREGRHYAPGTLLKVQHEGFRIGIGSGEIVENIIANNEIVGIRTMERFDVHEDRDYYVDFHVVDGDRNHVVNKRIQSVGEYTDRLMFSDPIPRGHDAPAMGNIVSVIDGMREGHARVWESKRCVVMDSSPAGRGYRLTLARYDDAVYRTGAIDAIPEYRSRILPTAPRVYGAVPREPYLPPPVGTVPRIGENGNWWIGGTDTGIPAKGADGVSLNFRGEWSPMPFEANDVFTFQGRSFITITRITHAGATPPWPLTNSTAAQRFALLADRGDDGTDGLAPRVGPNGNWWVGDTDTGVPARGPAGNTPAIGPNGNWWIGGADTGLPADGREITSIDYHYQLNDTGAAPGADASGWLTTRPLPTAASRFLWARITFNFNRGGAEREVSLRAMHGQTGAAGPAGSHTETRFRTNNTGVANPGNPVSTDRDPANWSTSMTAPTSAGGSVWMIRATVNAANALVGTWTAPVMFSTRGTDGADGRGIHSIEIRFQRTNTAVAPTQAWGDAAWLANAPALDATNRWLWKIERTAFTSGDPHDTITLIAIHGQTGVPGQDGREITSIDYHYQLNNTGAAPSVDASGWLTTRPLPTATNRFLWARTTFNFNRGSPEREVSLRAMHGRDGSAPVIGQNGNWWIDGVDTGIKAHGEDGKHTDYRFAVGGNAGNPPGFVFRNNPQWAGFSPGTSPNPFTVEDGTLRFVGGSWVNGPNIGDPIGLRPLVRARAVGSSATSRFSARNSGVDLTRDWAWHHMPPMTSAGSLQFTISAGAAHAIEISNILILRGFADYWHDTPPISGEGEFLWMTRADFRGTEQLTDWSPPARITGPAGADGADGRGIASVTYAFLRNDSSAPPAANAAGWAEWNTAGHMPNAANRFLWYRETTAFTEGDPDVRVGLESIHGETGGAGRGIASITYRWRTTASAAQPPATPDGTNAANSWVATQPAVDTANRWLWFRQTTAFTGGGDNQVIVGLQAVHGQTGATGNYYALVFRRAPERPATPTGNNPAGWSDAPPAAGGDPLWMSRGIMSAGGVLQGTWSQPVLIEREGPPGRDGAPGVPAPRYRGLTAIADVNNTGIVNGEVMHPGDFVLFTGVTVGIWWQNRLLIQVGRHSSPAFADRFFQPTRQDVQVEQPATERAKFTRCRLAGFGRVSTD